MSSMPLHIYQIKTAFLTKVVVPGTMSQAASDARLLVDTLAALFELCIKWRCKFLVQYR